jgi:large subunit ribosomal protein L9
MRVAMKVILLDNVRTVGQVGDVKDVNDGYARNFLIPRGLAKVATPGAAKDVEALKAKKLEASRIASEQAQGIAAKLVETTVRIAGKANEQGTLFAGIESSDLAATISQEAGVHIKPEQLHPHDHLKTVGEHVVTVDLADEVTADVKVEIVPAA